MKYSTMTACVAGLLALACTSDDGDAADDETSDSPAMDDDHGDEDDHDHDHDHGEDAGHEHEFESKTPEEVGLEAECWTGELACNPLTNAGCDERAACDVGKDDHGDTVLLCFEDEHEHEEDEHARDAGHHEEDAGHEHEHAHCDVVDDPACPAGHHCVGSPEGVCVELCCSDDDCGEEEACEALGNEGTLGVCQPTGECGGVGEACTDNAECCSNECHVDHCD